MHLLALQDVKTTSLLVLAEEMCPKHYVTTPSRALTWCSPGRKVRAAEDGSINFGSKFGRSGKHGGDAHALHATNVLNTLRMKAPSLQLRAKRRANNSVAVNEIKLL